MTEVEWLACTNPQAMLDLLGDRASERKLRLFACACCRRSWDFLTEEPSRRAVEVAELFADGLATREDLHAARQLAWDLYAAGWKAVSARAEQGALRQTPVFAWGAAADAAAPSPPAELCLRDAISLHESYWNTHALAQLATCDSAWWEKEAATLRCLFGNPFRPVTLDRSWRTPTVVNLAQEIYDDRAFHRLPALADGLEEAGCHDLDSLAHCRQPGPHARGCWVVDLFLGKAS